MKRRHFLTSSFAATTAGVMTGLSTQTASANASQLAGREFYELRTYEIDTADMQSVMGDYLAKALLPALGRQGLQRIGVFKQIVQDNLPKQFSLYVVIPYPSLDIFAQQRLMLTTDAAYLNACEQYYAQPSKPPAYTRINSRLMVAFSGMPVMELPPQAIAKQDRLYELRIYESHNEDAARRKVEMFNQGEIDLMRNVALGPVMYGETLIGDNVPNLTYMLSAPDMESHKAHWKAFIDHPKWATMKEIERYKGTVSNIKNFFLTPTECSQM